MRISEILNHISLRLTPLYGAREAAALARRLMADCYNLSTIDLIMRSNEELAEQTQIQINMQIERLEKGTPIQHISGFEEFRGRRFSVSPSVLIPRPETEELVELIVAQWRGQGRVLDIGTGSGAIAISLALDLSTAEVQGWDISPQALEIASRNSRKLGSDVTFRKVDILDCKALPQDLEVVVSNPPYVTESEKELMHTNVNDHEPHLALFVPDSDPLLFYRHITELAADALISGGRLYFEINERFGPQTAELLIQRGFVSVEILRDTYGRERIVKGERP